MFDVMFYIYLCLGMDHRCTRYREFDVRKKKTNIY